MKTTDRLITMDQESKRVLEALHDLYHDYMDDLEEIPKVVMEDGCQGRAFILDEDDLFKGLLSTTDCVQDVGDYYYHIGALALKGAIRLNPVCNPALNMHALMIDIIASQDAIIVN